MYNVNYQIIVKGQQQQIMISLHETRLDIISFSVGVCKKKNKQNNNWVLVSKKKK